MTPIPSHLPPRIAGLASLAENLSWSWHREARALFREIDPPIWHGTSHNPIEVLRLTSRERLQALADDAAFLARYDAVMAWAEREQYDPNLWFRRTYGEEATRRPIAYFCAEFGVHSSVPIYSGGLGVLAGDHCKAASDLGVPLVAVGLGYRRGYMDQQIRADGWQEDSDKIVDPERMPLHPARDPSGAEIRIALPCFGHPVTITAWTLRVGRVLVYLLDTDLEENDPEDRSMLHRLYAGGPDLRLRQEWILGTAGLRLLRAAGHDPAVWHANEGHAAFMLVEQLREGVAAGVPFEDAVSRVRARSVFTSHTPVPAGHDVFDREQVEACAGPIWDELGIDRDRFFALADHPEREAGRFHMSVLALSLAGHVNGVSARHGRVSRELWKGLWPDRPVEEVPIGHVTNGVHLATWMANDVMGLLDQHLGGDWWIRLDDPQVLEPILSLDPDQFWQVHLRLKLRLNTYIREDARRRFADRWHDTRQAVGSGILLDPQALTIGFARRFATYKRADLLFRDPERLRRLLVNPYRPVQLVISGKAHPADDPGKRVLQSVYRYTHDPAYEGRVAMLEDYEMHVAHMLVQGVDLWLNLPRVPLEACGTSGMKAALNGIPQLGTCDGWWEEGYTGENGWMIPRGAEADVDAMDQHDADALYRLLEEEVVPAYYERDGAGLPHRWIAIMRNALFTAASRFTARRMVMEYTDTAYRLAREGVAASRPPVTRPVPA